jgi:mannosylglycerate hydrolase
MPGLTFHLIPHTHWDREWYLTRAAFTARLVPMLDELLDRFDRDAGLRTFLLDGQTVLMEDYLRIRPDRRERIQRLVREGRLQVGPWYVLADELIPSGESLVRNLLLGGSDAARLGGRSEALYSPDAFGHPAVWPTLAAQFGIRFGALWRGVGGEPSQDGDLYRWRGPDGSEVLLYHLPPAGYEIGATLPSDWPAVRRVLTRRAATPHIAVLVGADHHAVHPDLGGLRDSLAAHEPDAGVRVSRLDEFLAEAGSWADRCPTLSGELRWSYGYTWTLQGVHGTRAPLKRRHAEAELFLERVTEPLAALLHWRNGSDQGALLDEAWRTLLRCQFHDSIAGCTSDAVARRVESRIEDAGTIAAHLARTAFEELIGYSPDEARSRPGDSAPALITWNPVPRRRGGVVVVDLSWFRRDVLVGPPGARAPRVAPAPDANALGAVLGGLPFQALGRTSAHERLDSTRHYPDQDEVDITRVAVHLPRLGGLGFARAVARPHSEITAPVRGAGRMLSNGLIAVSVELDGTAALLDLRTGVRYDRLLRLESEGDVGDTYSHATPAGDVARVPTRAATVEPLATGPLVGALEVRTGLDRDDGGVEVRAVLTLHADSPVLRCTLEITNGARDHRLRLRVPAGASGAAVAAGGPFGTVVRRRTEVEAGRYAQETPVRTAPAHRFVVAARGENRLAVLAPGFFEYEHTADGHFLITLLRAVGQLSRDDLPTRPGHAGWPVATPLAQCLGTDRLQLALCPLDTTSHSGAASVAEIWEDVFLPPRAVWLRQAIDVEVPGVDIWLQGEGLVFSACKRAANGKGIVLRCYNDTERQTTGRWRLTPQASGASRIRADESPGTPVPLADGGREIRFEAGPREVVSFRVLPLERSRH